MEVRNAQRERRSAAFSGVGHLVPALALLVLAPVTAEYLYGYDDTTGKIDELLGGLVIFAPLYGGAALIVREITRRTGRGWPTILVLGFAFGVLQAGLIDHSMFNPSYRDIQYWDEMFAPTFVSALGVNPNMGVMFAAGHMIWSIAAPIAVIEALVPAHRTVPWMGRIGMTVTTIGFVAAAGFVIGWHLETEDFVPSAGQAIGAATVVVALIVAALTPNGRPAIGERPTVVPWLAGAATFAIFALPTAVETMLELANAGSGRWPVRAQASWFLIDWTGFALNVALLVVLFVLLARFSSRTGWGPLHVVAVAGGALLANVATAFTAEPIGDVTAAAKYAHNTIATLVVFVLLAMATRRQRRFSTTTAMPWPTPMHIDAMP